MKILLKADDFWGGGEYFYRFFELSRRLGTKINVGAVGDGVARASQERIEHALIYADLIEWFSHSYFHFVRPDTRIKEFFQMSEQYQRFSIEQTNKVIKERLNFDCNAIGFPANACDETTIRLLSGAEGDLGIRKVFYLKNCYNYNELVSLGMPVIDVNGYGILETPLGIDYDGFMERFLQFEGETIVFQLHPKGWDDKSFEHYARCIEYLKNAGHTFIFISEYDV